MPQPRWSIGSPTMRRRAAEVCTVCSRSGEHGNVRKLESCTRLRRQRDSRESSACVVQQGGRFDSSWQTEGIDGHHTQSTLAAQPDVQRVLGLHDRRRLAKAVHGCR